MDNSIHPQRPASITLVCLLGLLGVIIRTLLLFPSVAQAVGFGYAPHTVIMTLINAICFLGLWRMKKWAAYSYILILVSLCQTGTWDVVPVGSIIALFIILKNLPKMT